MARRPREQRECGRGPAGAGEGARGGGETGMVLVVAVAADVTVAAAAAALILVWIILLPSCLKENVSNYCRSFYVPFGVDAICALLCCVVSGMWSCVLMFCDATA